MARAAGSLAVFAAVALLVPVGVFRGVEALGVPPVEVALDAVDAIDEGLAGRRDGARDRRWRVGLVGDSMLVSYPPESRVPDRLQQVLDQLGGRAARVEVHSLATPGLGPFDYYFLADRVAAAGLDQVILSVNLSALTIGWREAFARPELAGFLPPSRLLEALGLPLDWIGLTADRLLGYVALVQLGGADRWHALMSEQARLSAARKHVSGLLSARFAGDAESAFARDSFRYHEARIAIPKTQRLSPAGVEERLGRALSGVAPDDPTLELLAAAVRVFRSRGVDVLVYTNPINVRHLEAVGAANPDGLARTLQSIRIASEGAGARFVDLHDLLPDAGFRDYGGHLDVRGDVDGPLRLARRLAPLVLDAQRRAGR